MDIRFRQMKLDDVMNFSLMEQRYFDDCVGMPGGLLTYLHDSRFSFVCEVDGRLVGACMVERAYESGLQRVLISSICVEPLHRRLGIARKLICMAISSVHRHLGRDTHIGLMVSARNAAAMRLYESIGFRTQSVVEGAYFDGTDGHMMTLK